MKTIMSYNIAISESTWAQFSLICRKPTTTLLTFSYPRVYVNLEQYLELYLQIISS